MTNDQNPKSQKKIIIEIWYLVIALALRVPGDLFRAIARWAHPFRVN